MKHVGNVAARELRSLFVSPVAYVVLDIQILSRYLLLVVPALCVLGWVGFARLVRGEVLSIKEREYVTAARVLGSCHSVPAYPIRPQAWLAWPPSRQRRAPVVEGISV